MRASLFSNILISEGADNNSLLTMLRHKKVVEQFRLVVEAIGEKKILEILQNSHGLSLKEISLILLNVLDSEETKLMTTEMWRFLLAMAKAGYVADVVMREKRIIP